MENERDLALRLANKVLDNASRDPDDDLSIMSRQFLRAVESSEYYRKLCALNSVKTIE